VAEAEKAVDKKADGGEKKAHGIMPVLLGSLVSGGLLLGGMAYLMQAQNKELKGALEAAAKGKGEGGPAGHEAPKEGHGGEAESKGSGFYDLDEFLVNLANPGGGRYLRATLSLRFKNESAREVIKASQPRVRDLVIECLSARSTQDLAAREGKAKLKDELLTQLTRLIPEAGFDGVFLLSFTVQ
jgi:flagellar FliL protein